MNKSIDGALLGLIVGSFYFIFVFVMGMQANDLVSFIAFFLITFAVITTLVFWLPLSRIWIYPLSFALPTILVGVIALTGAGGVPTIVVIGSVTFIVGLIAAHVAKKLRVIYPRKKLDL
jgi:hypothetical protein